MSRGEYDEVISISKHCQCLYFIDSHWWLFCNIWCCICPSISSFIIKLTLTEQNDIGHVTHPRLRYNLYDKLYLILLLSKTDHWLMSMLYPDFEMGQVKKTPNLDFGNVFTEMVTISCFGLVLDWRNLLLDGSLFQDPSFCILVCGYFNVWSCRRRAEKKCNEEACIKKETAE